MGRPRLGIVDVGSNAIRLRIVETTSGDEIVREVTSARAPVRLGRDVFRSGRLSKAILDDATGALADFRMTMDREGVGAYRAVATSATRDASNGAELVLRAERDAGIELETIDGDEEARLVNVAVARAVRLVGRTALADVGGGSTEVTLLDGSRRLRSVSLPLGTVRLLEAWNPEGGTVGRRQLAILTEVVDRALADVAPDLARAERIVATGGTVTALAKLCGRDGHGVSIARVAHMLERLRKMTEGERAATFGIRLDRADTILPAAVILTRVAAASGAKTIEAPGVGLRDGILAELAAESQRSQRTRPSALRPSALRPSASRLGA
jgi:exopolyphosphatase/guanosine-5'-triphosphate,3'-diphosphate pyrophosphatase